MGRLIDAYAFEKFIKEKYKDDESTDDIKDQILFDLSYQPTAYDPEKVVAELEERRKYNQTMLETYNGATTNMYYEVQMHTYERAIEIVRKGGAE